MSLNEIRSHLQTAHDQVEKALNGVKVAVDSDLNRAHVAVGAAMAIGLSGDDVESIAGQLTDADDKATELVELLAAIMSRITDLGSL